MNPGDGIAWVAFWKEGRSWNGEYFYQEADDTLSMKEEDPAGKKFSALTAGAVSVNGYYCGHIGEEMSVSN